MRRILDYEKELLLNLDLIAVAQDSLGIMARPYKVCLYVCVTVLYVCVSVCYRKLTNLGLILLLRVMSSFLVTMP